MLLLSFSTIVNYFGIETATRVNIALLGLQLVLLAVVLVLAVIALMHGVAGAHLSMTPLYNAKLVTPHLIFGALSLAVLSFLGFDAVSTLAEETVGGPHLVGRATILSLCLAAVLFVVQTYLASLFVLGRTHFTPGSISTQEACSPTSSITTAIPSSKPICPPVPTPFAAPCCRPDARTGH